MKKLYRPFAILLTLVLLLGAISQATLAMPGDRYPYDQPGDKNFMTNTGVLERYSPTGSNNQSTKVTAPRAQADAAFTTEPIVVDGIRDAAWDGAVAYPVGNKFNTTVTAAAPTATAQGTLRLMWDGPVLYALVEVTGDSTKSDTGTPNWTSASYTPTTDGLFVFMDVFNDQWGMETDTQGVFFLGANPALSAATSFNNGGIPSLGSFFNAANMDYSPRLKAFKSSGYSAGDSVNYTYEVALQTEGWGDAWNRELVNGAKIGLEIGIFNQGSSFTYWSKAQYFAGREGSSNLPNSERVRNRDWGEVTLAGWDEVTPFAYSGWRADEDIRFWNSKSNPGGTGAANSGDNSNVWTAESKARMTAAKNAYLALKAGGTAAREEMDAAVLEVCQAFAGLRWAGTKYPDPHDLPALNTLPNVWQFFDPARGTNGMVTNLAEWAERKEEIRDLAQFYEYGYKPQLGVDYTISITTNAYAGTGNASVVARVTPTNVNYTGGTAQNVTVNVTMPTTGVPAGQKAPVAIGGGFTAYGIANIGWPTWGSDNRSDAGAWGSPNRSGTFYALFPYARNSTTADSSVTIAQATAVSVYLDILQMAAAQNPALNAKIDPTKAITKGFSFQGKYAFVAGVFDERVKAVVAGGAGATGPANWRYNVQGQEYNFSSTIFYNPGAEAIVSHGTEGPGNSYRHNRVRETELFRHFLPYGHEYAHADGSYAYAEFSRLPFDQALLVATFAPDRAIIIDTNLNDYNDGAVTDNMSLEIARFVYQTLGANPDNLVKFNSGNYVSSGDPHGAASAVPEGHYLSDLFYGTTTLTAAEAARLNTDPYNLNVANGQTQTPYEYYWGGFNTITGGDAETNGWAYYTIPSVAVSTSTAIPQYSDPLTLQAALSPAAANGVPAAGSVEFFVDGVSVGSAAVDGSGAASLAWAGMPVPGSYTLTAAFTSTQPSFAPSSAAPYVFTVAQEDARAYYNGSLLFWTPSITSTTAEVTLSAAIRDITAVDPSLSAPDPDTYPGDIRGAAVTFINRETNTELSGCIDLPVGLVSPDDLQTGTVTCKVKLSASSNTGAAQYTLGIRVSGYYTRDTSMDDFIVDVAQPIPSNFITGGGNLVLENSSGMVPGDAGSKANFGFHVKYTKSGKNLQGSINIIVRGSGRVYQIKGNAVSSLGVAENTANFSGKASIIDITDPLNPLPVDGNATLQLWLTDNDDTGAADTLAIQVLNKAGGTWFSSSWNGMTTVEQTLGGGNLAVH